jgi:hypothetical protein
MRFNVSLDYVIDKHLNHVRCRMPSSYIYSFSDSWYAVGALPFQSHVRSLRIVQMAALPGEENVSSGCDNIRPYPHFRFSLRCSGRGMVKRGLPAVDCDAKCLDKGVNLRPPWRRMRCLWFR